MRNSFVAMLVNREKTVVLLFRSRRFGNQAPTTHQTITGRKRFYKYVTIEPVSPFKNPYEKPFYKILLDGKTLKTPGRNLLHIPSMELASAIACEWDAQDNRKGLQPATMPLMSLASTAIDQVTVEPETAITTCMKYFPTDTALFYATEAERILLQKQREAYLPIIRSFRRTLGIEVATTNEFTGKLVHPKESEKKLYSILKSLDPYALTCVQSATMEFKSVILALSLFTRAFDMTKAVAIARIEEEFQIEIWGDVEGGHDVDRLNCSVQLSSVDSFLRFLYSDADIDSFVQNWKGMK